MPTWTNPDPNLSISSYFTATDVLHMKMVTGGNLDLSSYASVKVFASAIYARVSTGNMPPMGSGEATWTTDRVNNFKAWMDAGCPEQ
jgi:hypothetical protein